MAKEPIRLSDHFTTARLLQFVMPCIGTMLFTSIYGIVDGLCVSNFVGKTAFAAVNLIMPFPMLLGAAGFMLGTGGSAIVAITLGAGDEQKANRYFSLFVWAAVLSGAALAGLGLLLLRPVAIMMGAEGEILDYALRYGRILTASVPSFALQNLFQSFFVTAEKPNLGLAVTVAAGCTNMLLDVVLVGALGLGVEGAAAASLISQVVGGVLPLLYFLRPNDSRLRLARPRWEGRVLLRGCANGSSELMTNLSMSLVNILYNYQLMRFAGADGVAAYGVIMYANFLFVAVFVGYSVGSAPIVGFHYGARNRMELNNLYVKSLRIIGAAGVGLTAFSIGVIPFVARVFVGYDAGLLELTTRAFRIYALSFVVMGFNIYGSSFFTALGDGVTSALISFLRTLAFQLIAVLLLPELLGIDGVWMAVTAAELAALVVTAVLLRVKDRKFHYRHAA
ncbi:MAG: MATE family efflux transporter [Faecalibacterium sp.]